MDKKRRNILWLAGLFLFSFFLGWIGVYSGMPTVPANEFPVFLIMMAMTMFIIFGVICLVVYFILKKKNSGDPSKISLIVFSALMGLGVAGNLPKAIEGMKKRKTQENRRAIMQGMNEGCLSAMKLQLQLNPEMAEFFNKNGQNICDCMVSKVSMNNKIIEELSTSEDPKNAIMQSEEIKSILMNCLYEHSDSLLQR